jgi:nickel/cobalt exporter
VKPKSPAYLPLIFLIPAVAWAHAQYRPFSTNRYLLVEFSSERLLLTYDITVGDVPAGEIKKRADDDGNGWLQEGELRAIQRWLERSLQTGFSLQLDGKPVEPGWSFFGQWGELQTRLLSPMRLRFQAALFCPPGVHRLLVHDRTELPALEQSELLVSENESVNNLQVFSPAGRQAHIFWNGGEKPQPVEISFALQSGSPEQGQVRPGALNDELSALKRALAAGRLGWTGWLWTILLALFLGAGHALSPGHGKTIMAAYLVGSGGRLRHALVLGLVVTLAHLSSVIIIGLVALWAAEKMLPEKLAPWLELASGLLVLVVSSSLLWRRIQIIRGKASEHRHHHHPEDVSEGSHLYQDSSIHPPGKEMENHHHHPASGKAAPRWSELISLGFSGGLVPCPSALVLLLVAVYNRKFLAGLLLILAFSLGLALTLVIVGILAVRGARLVLATSPGRLHLLKRWLPVGSAIFLSGVGVVMTVLALKNLC